ncbi:tyrosine-type recombinase/integrase [Schlesneria sp. T3-172]|uniref:tyrosine-type recombinase/integrase n=1 Tax=Schlesneria sphaerica TaxID=3373610 RepID=UPI0037C69B9B
MLYQLSYELKSHCNTAKTGFSCSSQFWLIVCSTPVSTPQPHLIARQPMAKPLGPKPTKPYKDFPLFPHAAGVWAKKIKGKLFYFGPWSDPDGALAKYKREVDDRQAGRVPRPHTPDGYTLLSLANQFMKEKKIKSDEGGLSLRLMLDYQKTCAMLLEHFGRDRLVDDIRPEDFRDLRAKIGTGPRKKRGTVTIANIIRIVRIIFKFASDNEAIDRPINFGTAFKLPTKTEMRRSRALREKRLFSADEIRLLLAEAGVNMRAMILLGINAGMGPTDISQLPITALDLKNGWLEFPRPKTAVNRRAKLWPETVEALKAVIESRPAPKNESDSNLVFLTRHGHPWVRCKGWTTMEEDREHLHYTFSDAVGKEFKKVLRRVKLERDNANFYGLRHTFLTVADGAKDKPATDMVMGHVTPGIDTEYREHIEDARLLAVVNHVHAWLWPKPVKRAAKKVSKKAKSKNE